jgi:uncharacterized repeat protein (TIGR01451 family)
VTTPVSGGGAQADLSIAKADTPDPVAPGGVLTYTITLTNDGPAAAQDVVVTDAVPSNTTFVSATAPAGWTVAAPPVGGTGTITFSRASLGAGESAAFTVVVAVDAGITAGSITNAVTASSATADPVATNNTATTTTTVAAAPGSADLALLKSASPDPVATGQDLTYTLTVFNGGPSVARDVVVTDTLPAGTVFKSCSAPDGDCSGQGNVRTVTFPSIPAGASATATIVVTVDCSVAHGAILSNESSVASATPDPNTSNNATTATTAVFNPPPSIFCPGDVRVAANGATSAQVTYRAPDATDNCSVARVTCEPASGSTFPLGTTVVRCTAVDSSGASASCSFRVTVADSQAPEFDPYGDVSIPAGTSCTGVIVYPLPTTNDPQAVITCTPASGTVELPAGGTQQVTCTATDTAGNSSILTFTVTVIDPGPDWIVDPDELQFGPAKAERAGRGGEGLARDFVVRNAGCRPIEVTLRSLERFAPLDGLGADLDDTRYFCLREVGPSGPGDCLEFPLTITVQPGQERRFRLSFRPEIPATAGRTRNLAASQVLPSAFRSKVALQDEGGGTKEVELRMRVRPLAQLINAADPSQPATVSLTRLGGGEVDARYAIYDPNLNLTEAVYQFTDSAGAPVGPPVTVNLARAVDASDLVEGQSLNVRQHFSGVPENAVSLQVTIRDGDGASSSATSAKRGAAKRQEQEVWVDVWAVAPPDVDLRRRGL